MFIVQATGAYPRDGRLKDNSLKYGLGLALPANIRLGWRCFPVTNTLAHYEHSQITGT
jgi:hypothetical protein